jgi:hypothetical protein
MPLEGASPINKVLNSLLPLARPHDPHVIGVAHQLLPEILPDKHGCWQGIVSG